MTEERRRFYRIDDELALCYRSISPAELDEHLEDFWANQQALATRNDYNFQIEQHMADRAKIESSMPELARYLGVMEKQLDRISEKLIADEQDQQMTVKSVNLSAQGIHFIDAQIPQPGEMVELKLKLLPSGLRLVIIARVVNATAASGPGGVSLDFEHLHETDREILIKHMHGRQMEALSSARDS